MTKVQVCFSTIFGYITFAVLIGV